MQTNAKQDAEPAMPTEPSATLHRIPAPDIECLDLMIFGECVSVITWVISYTAYGGVTFMVFMLVLATYKITVDNKNAAWELT